MYDTLIIGAGISGLSLANKLISKNQQHKIALISKSHIRNTSSYYAQGGIAASMYEDEYHDHICDTIKAGNYNNDLQVVDTIVRKSSQAIYFLRHLGVQFDTELAIEAGHSRPRIFHCSDKTGENIMNQLHYHLPPTVDVYEENATSLNVIDNACYGLYTQSRYIEAKNTVICSGGVGGLFSNSSNPETNTGDGIIMAGDAGAKLSNIHQVQFHPTGFYSNHLKKYLLISETVRGAGARICDLKGNAIVDPLLQRDKLSKILFDLIKTKKLKQVYLDVRSVPLENFENLQELCRIHDINPFKEFIPIVPVQHYIMGGIQTNIHGLTTIDNLYACGECAHTGFHGNNRLASNSLLECIVMGDFISKHLEN